MNTLIKITSLKPQNPKTPDLNILIIISENGSFDGVHGKA